MNAVFEHKDQAVVTYLFKILLEDSGEDNNIDFNVRDQFGRTPFMRVCKAGNKKVVKLFMDYSNEKSIDLDARESLQYSNCGWTAFFLACHYGHSDVVKSMLEYSNKVTIDFNVRYGFKGCTPFMAACEQGHSQVVKSLLEKSRNLNIDVNAINEHGDNG